ncbi:hypothetical protein B7494_g2472 [Chlorociboria aeruginascens]|nr:hypothetical protein B7494_g2472 [Chlorociboria aeruginascens]
MDGFLARAKLDKPEVSKMQCMKILNDGSDGVFGKDAEDLSADDIIHLNSGDNPISARKPIKERAHGAQPVLIRRWGFSSWLRCREPPSAGGWQPYAPLHSLLLAVKERQGDKACFRGDKRLPTTTTAPSSSRRSNVVLDV